MYSFNYKFPNLLTTGLDVGEFTPIELPSLLSWITARDTTKVNSLLAADFDGSTQSLSSTSTDFEYGDADNSRTFWVKFDSVAGTDAVVGKWGNTSNKRSWLLYRNGTSFQLYYSNDGTSSSFFNYITTLSTGVW